MSVRYEWCIETVADDEVQDIIDLDHRDKFSQVKWALSEDAETGCFYRIALIRDQFSTDDPNDLIDRQWAYVENWKLPAEFDGGAKVPQRFHRECR